MNREDIIRMAEEAGPLISTPFDVWCERFAALVAASDRDRIADESKHIIKRAEQRGAEIEREACAKVADKWIGCDGLAAAIRARGNE